jgi:hypothetical protein
VGVGIRDAYFVWARTQQVMGGIRGDEGGAWIRDDALNLSFCSGLNVVGQFFDLFGLLKQPKG